MRALALLATFLAACSPMAPAPPPAPPTGPVGGVQIWNHTRGERTFRITATAAGGATVVLAEALRVPSPRDPVDPSLGGDPRAVGQVRTSLAAGPWRVDVVDDRGSSGRTDLDGRHAWAIAFAGPDGITIVPDTAPRRLE